MTSSKKEWLKVQIKTEPVLIEPISDFLIGIIGAGVETGARGEDSYGIVTGYVAQSDLDQEAIDILLDKLFSFLQELALLFNVAEPVLTSTMILDEDWGRSWKEHFKPFPIVPGLIISPTWEDESLPGLAEGSAGN